MRAWLVVITCAACSSNSAPRDAAPSIDAAPIDAAPTADADLRACANPGDCPCFSNYDCPPTHACVSMGSTVSCVRGPRGTGAAGAPCAGEADCASALCVDDAQGGTRCSDLCTTPDMCPPELPRCLSGIGICARNP